MAKVEHVLVGHCARGKKDLHLLHLIRKNTGAQILHKSGIATEDVVNDTSVDPKYERASQMASRMAVSLHLSLHTVLHWI